ncbi:Trehalose-phosphatase [Schizosaccharomyces pombe]|uniref:Trehalose-phosphatase n=1 Tax=Schizosaccharomyces pombe (strain 972 / ATCC 24843) TaxID=284812 RepID=TPP1_SCHPO|nr:trehalose-6-phosphate phosphatase Tpp1 [Schizosaccharomyces pombe]P78875.2 RecName: Full=Trehalose-phosphatase; AltName: Full=Trehalose-6-phosphate phosphatase; Short=TPP [Schizosaccharomyces pombe 972h-]CAB10126.1 trehalose-6-phosphate phosphatase Tpp1 [Schizosaccharomyces pombe]CAB45142.1 trehalose-6P phosphatase [Schizosaccharomyces pombe]|eukprot:NP_594430.1 trehalose-6-phosphate phosphatase Tpp1 [Schizosaccharomyces pombe]
MSVYGKIPSTSFEHENTFELSGDLLDPEELKSLGVSGRIIYVLRHLPFKSSINEETREWDLSGRRGATTMYSSMNWLANSTYWQTTLVGWTGVIPTVSEKEENKDAVTRLDSQDVKRFEETYSQWNSGERSTEYVPVWLPGPEKGSETIINETRSQQSRWLAYAENVIRPLIHYKYWPSSEVDENEEQWWRDYVKMNHAFADKICEIYKPGDFIIVQDYSLFLVPQLIRNKIDDAVIGFYHHHPFPSSEIARCFPRRRAILRSVLGADFIGFEDYSYARHFISCCSRVLDLEIGHDWVNLNGNKVTVRAITVGIDVPRIIRSSGNVSVSEKLEELNKRYENMKVILGRDRLDELYGVPQKLRSFQRFLRTYPEWRKKVVLIQITISSAFKHPKLLSSIKKLVQAINQEFGTDDYTPVHHVEEQLEPADYFALLTRADALFINSIREGVSNLALEYVVCQRDRYGMVLLSEFTATSAMLHDVPLINPWDYNECAEIISNALSTPLERRKMIERESYKQVTTHTMQSWTSSLIRSLANKLAATKTDQRIPTLTPEHALSVYSKASKRLFMMDYDGTLTPIVRDPNAAVPSKKLLDNLATLAADPKNQVWIISGRDQQFLRNWMDDIKGLGLSAEHGSFVRKPHSTTWINLAELLDMSWKKEVRRIFQYYTDRTQGSSIEEKRCAMTWHYRKADPENGAFQALECEALLEELVCSKYDVEIMRGKANLEVRPSSINKGGIVKQILSSYPEDSLPSFIFCAGDDRTDEDMFRSLHKNTRINKETSFAVTIGSDKKLSIADWCIADPANVIDILADLANFTN